MSLRTPLAALALLAAALVVLAGPAAAHKTGYSADGKVRVTWGFLNEPAVTYTKTGLDLILRDNVTGAPLEGAEKQVTATLLLGGETHVFEGLAAQSGADKKGSYTDVVTLTRPGLYSLRVQGTANGSAVDVTLPAQHEVKEVGETYFPDAAAPSQLAQQVNDLQAEVAALKADLKAQAETPASVAPQAPPSKGTPAPGLLPGLAVLGVAALLLTRRRAP
jgi:MYXO-CTERM domain-containing protein